MENQIMAAPKFDGTERLLPTDNNHCGGEQHQFGQLVEDLQRTVSQAVEKRLLKGDFVSPAEAPDADKRAANLANNAGEKFRNFRDDGFNNYGPGMTEYVNKAREATRSIDRQETEIADRHWQALSTQERQAIEQEKAVRDIYAMQALYRAQVDPPSTPHLDALAGKIGADIAALERQRQEKLLRVWQELPIQTRARIIQTQEEAKHFKAL